MKYIPGITEVATNQEEVDQLLNMAKTKENWRFTDVVGVPEQQVPVLGNVLFAMNDQEVRPKIGTDSPPTIKLGTLCEQSVVIFFFKNVKHSQRTGWHKWINGYWYPLEHPMDDVISWIPGPSYRHLKGHIKRKKGR
jgi:hypothetical protein